MNDLKWMQIREGVFELRANDNVVVATMSYHECINEWQVDLANIFNSLAGDVLFVAANTKLLAQQKAIVEINNYCNRVIDDLMRVIEYLSSSDVLYNNAY